AHKFDPGTQQWTAFAEDANNTLGSAASSGGVCPLPGDAAYESGGVANGLVAGNDCVQVTIEDNGANDSNAAAGTIADPIGFGGSSASVQTVNTRPASANAGGCTLAGSATTAEKRADWWLLSGLLGWLGLSMHRRRTR
ncbi:MAG: hypothetical protein GXP23_05515, partial [Gammaproteobacteria bacterium]|nr:hypothetical protein [Gammaproteobacteria bacterium]